MATHVSPIVSAMGGLKVFGKAPPADDRALRAVILLGLPVKALTHVEVEFQISREQLARILQISKRSLDRLKQKDKLGIAESDRLYRLVRTGVLAEDSLGDRSRARAWLREPNRALGGSTPIDLLDTEIGARMVEDVLGRIRYGGVS